MDALTVDELVDLAAHDPDSAARLAQQLFDEAADDADRAVASLALGVAARARNDIDDAVGSLRRAVRLADRVSDRVLAARSRVSLAAALAYRGELSSAIGMCARALPELDGRDRLAALATSAGLLLRAGRVFDAERDLSAALALADVFDDHDWRGRVLNNRAILRGEQGRLLEAATDLDRAARSFERVDARLDLIDVLTNRAWVAGLAGDLANAIRLSERAEREYGELGLPDVAASVASDRAASLLRGGLLAEAEATASYAVGWLERQGMAIDADECRLVAAEAALALQRPHDGLAVLAPARRRRPLWQDRRILVEAQLQRAVASPTRTTLRRVRSAARRLDDSDLRMDALRAHLLAADLATDTGGRPGVDLRRACSVSTRGLPVLGRIDRGVAAVRLAIEAHDVRAAIRHLGSVRRLLLEHSTALGGEAATAVHAAGRRIEQLAAVVSAASDDPRHLMATVEVTRRAMAARLTPRDAHADPEVRRCLAVVRAADGDPQALAVAERSLRLTLLALDHRGDAEPERYDIAERLDGRALIVLSDDGADVVAAVTTSTESSVARLGPSAGLARSVGRLRHAAAEAARWGRTDSVRRSADSVSDQLAPLFDRVSAASELVVVPSSHTSSLCWSLLDEVAGRPVVVAPSTESWVAAERRWGQLDTERMTVIGASDPGLPSAADELDAIGRVWGRRFSVVEPRRCPQRLSDADVAHLAAHGHVRADSPLFSSVRLGDTTLAWHQLVSMSVPTLMVLAACDVAVTSPTRLDVPVGGPAALLAAGAASVVAATGPIDDASSPAVWASFHAGIAAGARPAVALAQAGVGAAIPLVAFGC